MPIRENRPNTAVPDLASLRFRSVSSAMGQDKLRELQQVATVFNGPTADYPRTRRTHELIAEQAALAPDRVVIEADGVRLTASELNRRANQLAHHLQELGVGPDVPVGLCVRRSSEMVIAMLGVWKAGGAYVPLDPDFPLARLKLYLEDSGAPVVITQTEFLSRLPEGVARVVDLDVDHATIATHPVSLPKSSGAPTNLAYVIYTSGSTGTPNGVAIEHRALVNFLWSMRREPGLTRDDVVAAVTTISFDIHHLELWLPLVVGARLTIVNGEDAPDGIRLAEALARTGATVFQATPARWRLLLAAGWAGNRGMKALCGGEPMPADLAEQLLEKTGELWNMYGPTETTVWSTVHRVTTSRGPIPIGHAIANTSVHVLDQALRPVPSGEIGELYIGGDGLARGYWNRPELTAARFVPNPSCPEERIYKTGDLARFRPDGLLECLGRIDHQVKIRGHRIELGEIESALAADPSVAAAAVRPWGDPPQLAAYIVARPGEPQAAATIRQRLGDRLPSYMVPSSVTFVDALPLTPNGKIDRRALPDPSPEKRERTLVEPRTDAERAILAIWKKVLGQPTLSVTDNFFELGGTSLQAAEIVAGIRQELGHTLVLGVMAESATVEKLAALIQNGLETASPNALVPLQTEGRQPPLFMIAGIGGHIFTFHKFARLLGPDFTVYGLKAIGVDGDRPPLESFEEIAAEYVREITTAHPKGPYLISGYSIGAHVALEVALQLQALGHQVPLVVVFDMPAPGYPPPVSVSRRLVLHLRNLFRREGGVRYAVRRFQNLGNRLLRLLGLESWLFPEHPALDALPQESLRAVWVAMQRAARRYHPKGHLNGAVTLFRAELPLDVWDEVVHADPCLGWEAWTKKSVEVHTVACGHLEVFHESNIASLAQQVAKSIESATTRS